MEPIVDKERQWLEFSQRVEALSKKGNRSLRRLSGEELTQLINDYQGVAADLARARSLNAPQSVVDRLNRIAVAGHILLYGHMRQATGGPRTNWLGAFADAVRKSAWAVALSAGLLFGPAILTFFAVQLHNDLAFDLVPEPFIEFNPAAAESMHAFPSLARPMVSSFIIANNVQVTLLAFGFGLTAGLGTAWILIFNGIQLGAVAGWMTLQGKAGPFWGWVMPHGSTELIAIALAGAAGFLIAGAIISPGDWKRPAALRRAGARALVIEAGCMVMLLFAGAIEGFVSPSQIGFPARLGVLGASLALWGCYFLLAGRGPKAVEP